LKIILVAGARPNFMKVAPILKAIRSHNSAKRSPRIKPLLVHTGQHYDYEMSAVFFEDLDLPQPDIYLGVGSGSHAEQTGRVMIEFEKVLLKEKPDLVMVVGDVNSTLAAALAASKLHIPIAHVEAGIRSGDTAMPEEVNRLLTDHISDYLFTTSHYDDENLRKEGIPSGKIFRVGNVMVDSLLESRYKAEKREILSKLGLKKKDYALLTLHRPSNVDNREVLICLLKAVNEISEKITVVFPAHPRTQKMIKDHNIAGYINSSSASVKVIDPLGYLDFINLEMNARLVITDSGGVQVETTILEVPCLTLLDVPVWKITHDQGTNRLVTNKGNHLKSEVMECIKQSTRGIKSPELWDGKTGARIIKVLCSG